MILWKSKAVDCWDSNEDILVLHIMTSLYGVTHNALPHGATHCLLHMLLCFKPSNIPSPLQGSSLALGG